jgi:hypothetical protein
MPFYPGIMRPVGQTGLSAPLHPTAPTGANILKIANKALRNVLHRLCQGVLYFQNVALFYRTHLNAILLTPKQKRIARPA